MNRSHPAAAGLIATLFFALHLPFIPISLEDLDSINFALGVRDFDVSRHQPHPPGYPLFVVSAKTIHTVLPSEPVALSALAIASGALSAFALVVLFRRITSEAGVRGVTIPATLVTMMAPLYWFTASRPLSDMPGLAAALTIQAFVLKRRSEEQTPYARVGGRLVVAAFLSGFATGIRSQIAWLTVPLVVLQAWRQPRPARVTTGLRMLAAFVIGGLVWGIPLVWISGGPAAYWRVLFAQGAEDLSGVAMVWTTPTVRQLVLAIYYAFFAPWSRIALAVIVLISAGVGLARLAFGGSSGRVALLTLAAAFGPYLLFDIFFQETITTRYALPLVVPVAYLAVFGLDVLPRHAALVATAALAIAGFVIGVQALDGYSRVKAPAFQMLDAMGARDGSTAPVLAMHRKEDFDLRRPMQWAGNRVPAFAGRLASTPKHEWLEVVKYWNSGGRKPVWFVADPLRSDLALFSHSSAEGSYRWSFADLPLIGGVRPSEMDWYVIDPPAWYLGEGWEITPETAGVARQDHRNLASAPATGWIRRSSSPMTLKVGGRNFGGRPANVHVTIDGRSVQDLTVRPGFFLNFVSLPARSLEGSGDYATLTITADPAPADVGIEQFDVRPEGQVIFGFGEGWHEQEYNPSTGVLWRWTSERAALRIRSAKVPLFVTLRGGTETFVDMSHVVVRAAGRIVDQADVGSDFSITMRIPREVVDDGETTVFIETDQTYVPAEQRWRLPTADRRRLGLKVYECRVTPAS